MTENPSNDDRFLMLLKVSLPLSGAWNEGAVSTERPHSTA
jgi:hypothetical protein